MAWYSVSEKKESTGTTLPFTFTQSTRQKHGPNGM